MDNRFVIDTKENREYLKSLNDELIEFGRRFPSEEGGSYYLGDDGTPWVDRPRETWITCRMAHVYSIAHMMGKKGCRELAGKAIKGLLGELYDSKSGGFYAGINSDGTIIPNKQCYAHAFVILAGTSGVLAGIDGAKELLDKALLIYDEKFYDEKTGLSVDTWDTDFTSLDDYRGLNANMHSVEAYLAVADALKDESFKERAGVIIDRVISWAEANDYRIPEHFTSDWKPDLECNSNKPDDPFKPYGATPGHGIEWSRLILQWALSTYKDDAKNILGNDKIQNGTKELKISKYLDASEKLYNRAVTDAWNSDGEKGIVYTTDWSGRPVVHDRMHWTLAEAINSSALLYKVTGNKKYADDYAEFLMYLEDKVHDHINGSWFHQLNEKNELMNTVWPGKSDLYHAFQATLIPYLPIDISIASAVKNLSVNWMN